MATPWADKIRFRTPLLGAALWLVATLLSVLGVGPALADSETWLFNGTLSGWTTANCTATAQSQYVRIDPGPTDPQFISPTISFVPATNCANGNYMRIGYRNFGGNTTAQFFFKNANHGFSGSQTATFPVSNDGAWHYYTLALANSDCPGASGIGDFHTGGTVTQIRIDPVQTGTGGTDYVDIDFIVLRMDTSPPCVPDVGLDPPPDTWVNTGFTLYVDGNDPPPDGASSNCIQGDCVQPAACPNPDRYGSGVQQFEWRIGTSGSWNIVGPQTFDIIDGTATADISIPGGALQAGVNALYVRARDRIQAVGVAAGPFNLYYDPIAPSAPGGPTANPSGYSTTNAFSISWTAGSDAHSGVEGYLWRINGGTQYFTTGLSISGALATQEGANTFEVRTVDHAGNTSAWKSVTYYYYPDYLFPATGLTPASGDSVALQQTFGWNSVAGASSYEFQISANASFASGVTSWTTDLTSTPVPGTAAPIFGQTYYWRVRALGSNPPDNWSTTHSFIAKLAAPPPIGQTLSADFPSGEAGDGVNTSAGAVTRGFTVLVLHGPGGDVPLVASYSSVSQHGGLLGPKWTWTLGQGLSTGPDASIIATLDDGGDLSFGWTGQAFRPALGIYDSLLTGAPGYTLVRPTRSKLVFDNAGRLQLLVDRNGNTITVAYADTTPTQFLDTAGRTFSLTVASGRLTRIDGPPGRSWSFSYNPAGYLSSFTDARGNVSRFEYDGSGRLTRVVDPRGFDALRCTFDGSGRVATQLDALGAQTTFQYNDVLRTTTILNPLGGQRVHVLDSSSRLASEIDEREDSTSYTYDANHNRTEVRDPRGNTTHYEYDTRGNIVRQVAADGGVTTTLYDLNNRPVRITDPLGHATIYVNDIHGNPTDATDALGQHTVYTYNSAGQILTVTDPNMHVTSYTYDGQGNLSSAQNGAGDLTTYGYDAAGRRTSSKEGSNPPTTFVYDPDDSLLSTTDPLGHVTATEYDSTGNVTATVDPRGFRKENTYDDKGRLIQEVDELGNLTAFEYDALDRRIAVVDPRGFRTTYEFDAVGNELAETDPLARTTRWTYDGNRNQTTRTEPQGQVTQYTYDSMNRLVATTDPLLHVTSTTYDLAGRKTSSTNPRGYVTTFGYDDDDRLSSVSVDGGATLQYSYDPGGNRVGATNANGHTTVMTYDGANRVLSRTNALGQATSYSYDAVGNLARRVDASGRQTDYTYDAAHRLTGLDFVGDHTEGRTYDESGNLTKLSDALGDASFAYDGLDRLIHFLDHFGRTLDYDYDSTGHLTAVVYPDGDSARYQFDGAGQLVRVRDGRGHSVDYEYDLNGNPSGTVFPNGVSTIFGHDAADRLTSILTHDVVQDTIFAIAYQLDANGNRIAAARVDRRDGVSRLADTNDFYATSAFLSESRFPSGADSVLLVSGDEWSEAVCGAALARDRGIPALVIPGDNLWASADSRQELSRLHALRPNVQALIAGSENGVSDIVEVQVESEGLAVQRRSGRNRFETARLLAPAATTAVLVGADDWRRGGAAALLAGSRGWPLLFCERDTVPSETQDALSELGVAQTVLVGADSTIGGSVAAWLAGHGYPAIRRYTDDDPGALSVGFVDDFGPASSGVTFLRSDCYQDAVSFSPSATVASDPQIFLPRLSGASSPRAWRWVLQHKGRLQSFQFVGGQPAFDDALLAELRTALRNTLTEYTYTPLDQLESEIVPGVDSLSYTYDLAGNRLTEVRNGATVNYTYDAAERLLTAGATSFTYDANGNRIMSSDTSGTTTFAYDYENRLTLVSAPGAIASYQYDGLGRLVRTTENGTVREQLIDPQQKPYAVLALYDETGHEVERDVQSMGLAFDVRPVTGVRYYHYDGLGSTAALTDSVASDVTHLGYEGYGASRMAIGSDPPRFGFVGRYGVTTAIGGLYFMRDRFYDSDVGGFLSVDPDDANVEDVFGYSPYLYTNDNPVNYIDADGHFAFIPIIIWGVGYGLSVWAAHHQALKQYKRDLAARVPEHRAWVRSNRTYGLELAKTLAIDAATYGAGKGISALARARPSSRVVRFLGGRSLSNRRALIRSARYLVKGNRAIRGASPWRLGERLNTARSWIQSIRKIRRYR